MTRKVGKKERLTREEWLALSLESLSRDGQAELRIDRLTESLGVTKGSFYWHFRDRADFVRCLVEYWVQLTNTSVIEPVSRSSAGPLDRLVQIASIVTENNLGRFELPMRTWASHNSMVAETLKQVDRKRLAFVSSLFAELGFEGEELATRTRVFVCLFSLENGLFVRESKKKRMEQVKRRVEFLTKR